MNDVTCRNAQHLLRSKHRGKRVTAQRLRKHSSRSATFLVNIIFATRNSCCGGAGGVACRGRSARADLITAVVGLFAVVFLATYDALTRHRATACCDRYVFLPASSSLTYPTMCADGAAPLSSHPSGLGNHRVSTSRHKTTAITWLLIDRTYLFILTRRHRLFWRLNTFLCQRIYCVAHLRSPRSRTLQRNTARLYFHISHNSATRVTPARCLRVFAQPFVACKTRHS